MTQKASKWLAQEVRDLLDAASVGLYEFIWLLRGAYPDASNEELRAWAAEALHMLTQDQQGGLVLLEWPAEDSVGTKLVRDVTAADWENPVEGRSYVAISRI